MLDMFEGEGAKRAPGDLMLGRFCSSRGMVIFFFLQGFLGFIGVHRLMQKGKSWDFTPKIGLLGFIGVNRLGIYRCDSLVLKFSR